LVSQKPTGPGCNRAGQYWDGKEAMCMLIITLTVGAVIAVTVTITVRIKRIRRR